MYQASSSSQQENRSQALNLLGYPSQSQQVASSTDYLAASHQQHQQHKRQITATDNSLALAGSGPAPVCGATYQQGGASTNIGHNHFAYKQESQESFERDHHQAASYGQFRVSCAQEQQQQVVDDGASFMLEEIGAIINSREFSLELPRSEQALASKQQPQVELATPNAERTKAAIYEHLKSLVSEDQQAPESGSASMNNNNNDNNDTTSPRSRAQMMARAPQNGSARANSRPFVEIVEQPAKCALRFRYKCEGRSAGSLPGQSSSAELKTYPAIRIHNYTGRAVVVISCVSKDAPYLAHPHNLVGKEGCKKGICTIVINECEPQLVRSFSGLGIQCVKRKDIEESLHLRESINVDPFRNGFQHKLNASNIDLNVVRLCFQVFIEGHTANKCDVPLQPVVSEAIHDKKAMSELVIAKLSHCSAPATGGREVILLCDRIARDDIQIRFFEERQGELIWEHFLDVSPGDVHKQVAICFKSPKYFDENIQQPAMARIQLKRLSDQQLSEPRLFQFLPCESDEDIIQRKRRKIEWVSRNRYALDTILQPAGQAPAQQLLPAQHHLEQQQQQQQLEQQQVAAQQHHHNQLHHQQVLANFHEPHQLQLMQQVPALTLQQQQQQQQHR